MSLIQHRPAMGQVAGGNHRAAQNDEPEPVRGCVTCENLHCGKCSLPMRDLDCGADRPKWREASWLVVARAIAPRLV